MVNGIKFCDTLENTQTMLAEGTYDVQRTFCKQYHRNMPVIECGDCSQCAKIKEIYYETNTPVRCPMFKIGNGVINRTDGRIIIGMMDVKGCIDHSAATFGLLNERIRKEIGKGRGIFLTIEK